MEVEVEGYEYGIWNMVCFMFMLMFMDILILASRWASGECPSRTKRPKAQGPTPSLSAMALSEFGVRVRTPASGSLLVLVSIINRFSVLTSAAAGGKKRRAPSSARKCSCSSVACPRSGGRCCCCCLPLVAAPAPSRRSAAIAYARHRLDRRRPVPWPQRTTTWTKKGEPQGGQRWQPPPWWPPWPPPPRSSSSSSLAFP